MTYHITCSTDNNYLQYCEVMLCSLFENNKDIQFKVHVLHSELNNESMDMLASFCFKYNNLIEFYLINDEKLKGVNRRVNSPVSIATYYRVLLPSLLDQSIDRVLYLDCDVIVLGDIKALYDLNLDNYGLAAVQDASPYDSIHRELMGLDLTERAFCAGVMMVNLDYWRNNNCAEALLDYSNKEQEKVYLEDQDALNYVFRNHWFKLPYKWARTPLSIGIVDKDMRPFDQDEYAFKPRIIHYAGLLKPWCDIWFPERKYYSKYVDILGINNPQVKKVGFIFKFRTHLKIINFYINKYVRPLLPNLIELVLKDVFNIIKLVFMIFKGRKSFDSYLLNRWLNKYNL